MDDHLSIIGQVEISCCLILDGSEKIIASVAKTRSASDNQGQERVRWIVFTDEKAIPIRPNLSKVPKSRYKDADSLFTSEERM